MSRQNRVRIARYAGLTLCLWVTTLCTPAHAYLDPGTGSMLLQVLVAGVVVVLFILKTYWRRTKTLLSDLLRKGKREDE